MTECKSSLQFIAEERETYETRRIDLVTKHQRELAEIDAAIGALDRAYQRIEAVGAKPVAPAKPRADVRALTLARFTEGREIGAEIAHTIIAHEIKRKPSEVRRALARLAATGQLTLSHEGFYRRAEQRSAAA